MNTLTPALSRPAFSRSIPFRLGVTSYVYPSDILENVQRLAPVVDDIELVFFESADASNLPTPGEIEKWRVLARKHDVTFTVHFPIDKALGSPDPVERDACLTSILSLIELCGPLTPHGWILHLEGIEANATPTRVREWQQDLIPLLRIIAGVVDDPRHVCVENLGYPFEWCEPLLASLPFSICLDFGHLWQRNSDWKAHLQHWLPRTRIMHLYGFDTTSRHYSLERAPMTLVREALHDIGNYTGVLTLETFGYDDTASSMKRLKECLGKEGLRG
jgi:sugar phosphate isomerase/epimerase